jgi:hypothetical protein
MSKSTKQTGAEKAAKIAAKKKLRKQRRRGQA